MIILSSSILGMFTGRLRLVTHKDFLSRFRRTLSKHRDRLTEKKTQKNTKTTLCLFSGVNNGSRGRTIVSLGRHPVAKTVRPLLVETMFKLIGT
jgi:hypothetical protein